MNLRGGVTALPVFEAGPFSHLGTPPCCAAVCGVFYFSILMPGFLVLVMSALKCLLLVVDSKQDYCEHECQYYKDDRNSCAVRNVYLG